MVKVALGAPPVGQYNLVAFFVRISLGELSIQLLGQSAGQVDRHDCLAFDLADSEVESANFHHFFQVDCLQDVVDHQQCLLGLVVDLRVSQSQ